jgi:hypothetical protein
MHLLALLEQCPESQAKRLKADLGRCMGLGDSGAVPGIAFPIFDAEDPLLTAGQAVQQYPLSIENKIDVMRAALQAFHKNRMTSTVTGYVFLIENTLTVARKALADIAHRHPDFSPERVAAIRRAIDALPQHNLTESACDHQIREICRMLDQLEADYVGEWGRV